MSNDGSVYLDRDPRYDGKHDMFFNESGSMSDPHGHVVENGQGGYDFARDVDGNVYIDNR
jgi:hypothetical protein